MSRIVLSLLLLIALIASVAAALAKLPMLPGSEPVYLPLILVAPPTPTPTPTPTPMPTPTPSPPTFEEQQVIALVNAERAKIANCPALNHNLQLAAAAEGHSQDMASNNFFGHTGSNGSTPSSRAAAAGYMLSVAENIAAGQPDPQAVFNSWMNSPEHRASILNCSLRSTGVGYVFDVNDTFGIYRHYWTQMFGVQ